MLLLEIPDTSGLANLGAVAVIAVFAVKEFFTYLKGKQSSGTNGNGSSVIKIDLGPLHHKLDQLLKTDAAGQKTAEWWELTFARIFKQCLDDHENKISRPINEDAAQSRQEIIEALRQLERRMSEAITEIHRMNRHRNEQP